MKNFGIADLERYSGIKAHTLRTWEVRYGIPKPARDKTNCRTYSLHELKQVLELATLNSNGYRISRLSTLSSEEVRDRLVKLKTDDDRQRMALINLLVSMHSLNISEFESTLNGCFKSWQSATVLDEIIYPFLRWTKLLWQGTRATEEHLVVTSIRKKLMYAIEDIRITKTKNKTVLLFLPDTRQLDLALLYTCFKLTYVGLEVIYMGNDISLDNLERTFEKMQPHFIYTYMPAKNNFAFKRMSSMMKELVPHAEMIVSFQGMTERVHVAENINVMSFDEALLRLSGAPELEVAGKVMDN